MKKENLGDFTMILLLVFIVLKITGLVSWSWYFVLSPVWVPLVLLMLLYAIGNIIFKK